MFFNSLNSSVISDNRKFWKTVKPLFSNKGNYGNKIKSVENEEIIDDDTKTAEELNNFFKTAVASLDIHGNRIQMGKSVSQNLFCFNEVTKAEVLKEINSINNKKANTFTTIP